MNRSLCVALSFLIASQAALPAYASTQQFGFSAEESSKSSYVLDTEPGHDFGAKGGLGPRNMRFYYTGLKTQDGKPLVYSEPGPNGFLRLGVLEDANEVHISTNRKIRWKPSYRKLESIEADYKKAQAEFAKSQKAKAEAPADKPAPKSEANAEAKTTAKTAAGPIRHDRLVLDANFPGRHFGDVLQAGARAEQLDGGQIRYSGLMEADTGKPRVFYKINGDDILVGTLLGKPDAPKLEIRWDEKPSQRRELQNIFQDLYLKTHGTKFTSRDFLFSGDLKQGQFGQLYKRADGKKIFFTGVHVGDDVIVMRYRYESPRSRNYIYVHLGKLNVSAPDPVIEWDSKVREFKVQPLKENQLVANTKAADGSPVYHTGKVDPFTGRELVWWTESQSHQGKISFGVLNKNKTVLNYGPAATLEEIAAWLPDSNLKFSGTTTTATAQKTYEPLARNKSLVVVPRTEVGGSSETNMAGAKDSVKARTKEGGRLNPTAEAHGFKFEDFKPSRIGATVRRLQEFPSDVRETITNSLSQPGNTGKEFGTGIATFYAGMGIIAAYQLFHDYPNNPVAWEKYVQQMTDPSQVAMLVAFMAAARPFMQNTTDLESASGIGKSVLPRFAVSMMAGMAAQAVIYYALQPDVRACTGVSNYKEDFKRDLAACDRFFNDMTGPEHAINTFAPSFADLIVGSGLWIGAEYLISASRLTQMLRSISLFQGLKTNIPGMVFSTALFLGANEVASKVVGLGKATQEYLIGTYHPMASYGSAIPQAETHLLNAWKMLKKRGFDGTLDYNDVPGLLRRYSALKERWRGIELASTFEAFQQWRQKAEGFSQTLVNSQRAYKDFLSRILQGEVGSDGFNPSAINWLKQNPKAIRWLDQQDPDASSFTKQSLPSALGGVATPHFLDFVVASMACGPEGEGYAPNQGFLSSAQGVFNTVKSYIPLSSPTFDKMVENPTGLALSFYPPRIVKHLPGTNSTVCNKPLFHPQSPATFAVKNPVTGVEHANLYEYIRANIREDVVSEGRSNFDNWWNRVVGGEEKRVNGILRQDYAKMLEKNFIPALTRADYQRCDTDKDADPDLVRILRRLGKDSSSSCPAEAIHRNAYGVLNSILDEARLYLALIIDAELTLAQSEENKNSLVSRLDSKDTKEAPAEGEGYKKQLEANLVSKAQTALSKLEALAQSMSQLDPKRRQRLEAQTDLANEAFVAFLATVYTGRPASKAQKGTCEEAKKQPSLVKYCELEGLHDQLLNSLKPIIERSQTYATILQMFENTLTGIGTSQE